MPPLGMLYALYKYIYHNLNLLSSAAYRSNFLNLLPSVICLARTEVFPNYST